MWLGNAFGIIQCKVISKGYLLLFASVDINHTTYERHMCYLSSLGPLLVQVNVVRSSRQEMILYV